MFFIGLTILSSFTNVISLSCISMKNQCRLDESICNNKQRWNNDKCKCECKELTGKGICDKGYIWNPNNCKCECDKWCDFGV